jgi:hypothetical protein
MKCCFATLRIVSPGSELFSIQQGFLRRWTAVQDEAYLALGNLTREAPLCRAGSEYDMPVASRFQRIGCQAVSSLLVGGGKTVIVKEIQAG